MLLCNLPKNRLVLDKNYAKATNIHTTLTGCGSWWRAGYAAL